MVPRHGLRRFNSSEELEKISAHNRDISAGIENGFLVLLMKYLDISEKFFILLISMHIKPDEVIWNPSEEWHIFPNHISTQNQKETHIVTERRVVGGI